jgi:putative ABC transport system permease protein
MLGIFIGVASVIWMLAFAEGISQQAQRQIESLGADTIIVRSTKPPGEKITGGAAQYGLTREEFSQLITSVPTIKSALPLREIQRQFTNGSRTIDGRLVGCTPEYQQANRLEIERGEFITDVHDMSRATVCVLASKIAETLFPFENPIGKRIRVPEHNDFYTVVGVLKFRNPSAAIGGSLAAQDYSYDVYIPIKTLRQRIGDTITSRRGGAFQVEIVELNQITLKVDNIKNVTKTAALVEEVILPRHKALSDAAVVVPLELLEQARTQRIMWLLIGVLIATISLVVGGIGIMNIMLATVTERTREIGIRRALGAKQGDILRQFLVETTTISVIGGAAGIIAGWACLPVVNLGRRIVKEQYSGWFSRLPEVLQNVAPELVTESIPLAFGISVLVGVVSGLYPALRAAKMNPIDALRHE